MFEQAVRLKLRFDSPKGALTIEDLYDLPLTSVRSANLNDIAKALNRELKETGEEDFVNKVANGNAVLQLKFDIVKHVIDTRLAENEAAAQKRNKAEQKDRILAIIARKQDEKLQETPIEDLVKMVEEL
jgi:hypothetical protein